MGGTRWVLRPKLTFATHRPRPRRTQRYMHITTYSSKFGTRWVRPISRPRLHVVHDDRATSRGGYGENELLEIEAWDRPNGMGYSQYITEDEHRPKMTTKRLGSYPFTCIVTFTEGCRALGPLDTHNNVTTPMLSINQAFNRQHSRSKTFNHADRTQD